MVTSPVTGAVILAPSIVRLSREPPRLMFQSLLARNLNSPLVSVVLRVHVRRSSEGVILVSSLHPPTVASPMMAIDSIGVVV